MTDDLYVQDALISHRIGGSFATRILQQVLQLPEIFSPVKSRVSKLEEVEPQHTIIFFIQPQNGAKLRLEGEIDCAHEGEEELFEAGTGSGQYQAGTTNLFFANTRNRRAQITTIDIERYEKLVVNNYMPTC